MRNVSQKLTDPTYGLLWFEESAWYRPDRWARHSCRRRAYMT
jgi:hypothetical protein